MAIAIGVKNMYIDLTTSGGKDPAFIRRVVDDPHLGADRIVWGSDGIFACIDEIQAKRRQFEEIGLSVEDQEKILWGTPARLLGV